MNKRIRKKKRVLERKHFMKLLSRERDKFRHSCIGLTYPSGTIIVGNKNSCNIGAIELMYLKYNIDPYRVNKLVKTIKNAVFDIYMTNAAYINDDKELYYDELYIENRKLYFNTIGVVPKCKFEILYDIDEEPDRLNRWFDVFEYIDDEIKFIPKNKDAERAIEYLDKFIVCWACGLTFYDYNKITSKDIIKVKTDLKNIALDIKNENKGENNSE